MFSVVWPHSYSLAHRTIYRLCLSSLPMVLGENSRKLHVLNAALTPSIVTFDSELCLIWCGKRGFISLPRKTRYCGYCGLYGIQCCKCWSVIVHQRTAKGPSPPCKIIVVRSKCTNRGQPLWYKRHPVITRPHRLKRVVSVNSHYVATYIQSLNDHDWIIVSILRVW